MTQTPQQASNSRAATICARHGDAPDALIEILHGVQHEAGFVSDDDLREIAHALNLSLADVEGVVSFYHDFRRAPEGRHEVQLCRAEACQAVGCEALADHAARRLGVAFGETTADGGVTLKAVYCLGDCALGPAAMIDGRLHGRLTPERFDALIAGLDKKAAS